MPNIVDAIRSRAPLPSGSYICKIAFARPINDSSRQGVRVTLEVMEGKFAGRQACVDFITELRSAAHEFAQARSDHDLLVLEAWVDLLGVSAPSPVALIAALRKAGEGKRVEFAITQRSWNGGVYLQVNGVRLAPANGGAGG